MLYALTIDQVPGLPDCYRITRRNGQAYTVRTLESLGKRLQREAQKADGLFLIRDQNGRALKFDPALNQYVYN